MQTGGSDRELCDGQTERMGEGPLKEGDDASGEKRGKVLNRSTRIMEGGGFAGQRGAEGRASKEGDNTVRLCGGATI